MKIKQLKVWLESLPPSLDDYDLVFRKIKSGDDEHYLVNDTPIVASGIDEGTLEAYLCDEKSASVLRD